jgi:PAS domain-containing protein
MDTFFAPAERASDSELQRYIAFVSGNPVINGLLTTAGGLLAVLNEQRQVLAVNDAFLKMLGINDPGAVLGLRPGEMVKCVHAFELPGGCGTSRFCSTCGVPSARRSDDSEDLAARRDGKRIARSVRAP